RRVPASAAVLDGKRQEESTHRASLLERYRQRFGDHVLLIRRGRKRPARRWIVRSLGLYVSAAHPGTPSTSPGRASRGLWQAPNDRRRTGIVQFRAWVGA